MIHEPSICMNYVTVKKWAMFFIGILCAIVIADALSNVIVSGKAFKHGGDRRRHTEKRRNHDPASGKLHSSDDVTPNREVRFPLRPAFFMYIVLDLKPHNLYK
ncbi:MAG TPA: hypothetical protein VKO67_06000, partial [Smithellaceae bacterium]|nr:hypothetical protein [Smithellaceae bacterium]